MDPGSSSALNDVYSNRSKIIQLIIVTSNPRHLESEFLSLNFISMANEQQNLLTETLFLKLSCTMWLKRNSKKEKSFHPLIKAALLRHSLASLLVRFQKLIIIFLRVEELKVECKTVAVFHFYVAKKCKTNKKNIPIFLFKTSV